MTKRGDTEPIYPQWYAVMTGPRAEFQANAQLRLQQYWTYLPFERVREKKKLPNRDAYKIEWVEVPYFPRYMFVRLPSKEHVASVNGTDGVSTVVYQGEEPLPISNEVMDELMSRADVNGLVRQVDKTKRKRFAKGQKVKFVDESPLAGFLALVAIDSGPQVRLFLEMFGKTREISALPEHIEAVSP